MITAIIIYTAALDNITITIGGYKDMIYHQLFLGIECILHKVMCVGKNSSLLDEIKDALTYNDKKSYRGAMLLP